MSQNVIKKTENFPSAGYTTFALMKNIKVIIQPYEGNTAINDIVDIPDNS